jgi:uncharacterized LabA/DUF88 family protein
MDRVAVFVDAGYPFAAGSKAISGKEVPRKNLTLNIPVAVANISDFVRSITDFPILRVYWYDGALRRGPSAEHLALGHTDNVKLRLGMLNSVGEQKEVDSLIITDLIELARNGAISDAVLISGDADTRVGVEIAQTFGVRVHLVGITPKRDSQSSDLLQSADTTHELDATFLSDFLSVNLPAHAVVSGIPDAVAPAAVAQRTEATTPVVNVEVDAEQIPIPEPFPEAIFRRVVSELLSPLSPTEMANLKPAVATGLGVPHEYDGRLLARSRTALKRELTQDEKRKIRSIFLTSARSIT